MKAATDLTLQKAVMYNLQLHKDLFIEKEKEITSNRHKVHCL